MLDFFLQRKATTADKTSAGVGPVLDSSSDKLDARIHKGRTGGGGGGVCTVEKPTCVHSA